MSDVYSLRCFHNGIRRFTHTLSQREAKTFLHTAKHLQAYLEKEYGFLPGGMSKVDETWTRADFRKLERLLLRRAKILIKLQDVNRKIIIADLTAHNFIRDQLDGV